MRLYQGLWCREGRVLSIVRNYTGNLFLSHQSFTVIPAYSGIPGVLGYSGYSGIPGTAYLSFFLGPGF